MNRTLIYSARLGRHAVRRGQQCSSGIFIDNSVPDILFLCADDRVNTAKMFKYAIRIECYK